jgi:hypothetical protein
MQKSSLFALAPVIAGTLVLANLRVASAQAVLAPSPAAATPSADQAVACIQNVYDRSTGLAGDFEQRFWVRASNQERSIHGRITFTPGKILWTYNNTRFESECTTLQCPIAFSFLAGGGTFEHTFNFQVL